MSDSAIMYSIILFFVLVGAFIPYVHQEFNTESSTFNQERVSRISLSNTDDAEVNAKSVLFSVLKMFLWSFGSLPFWIDATIFIPLRIMLAVLVYRNLRGVGG